MNSDVSRNAAVSSAPILRAVSYGNSNWKRPSASAILKRIGSDLKRADCMELSVNVVVGHELGRILSDSLICESSRLEGRSHDSRASVKITGGKPESRAACTVSSSMVTQSRRRISASKGVIDS